MDLIYWLVAIATVLFGLYLYGTWPYGYFSKRGLPFIQPVPFVGNAGPMVMRSQHIAGYLQDIYNKFKDEHKLIGFYEFLKPITIVCDPGMIRLVTVKDSEYFLDHRSAITEDLDPLIGKNLFALEGQRWKNMRSTLSPAFTSHKMKGMFLFVTRCGEQMADHIDKRSKGENLAVVPVELKEFFTRYANDVIATSAFGIHCDSLEQPENEFYMMGKVASNVNASRLLVFFGFMLVPKFMKYMKITLLPKKICTFFRSLIHDTIEIRERENIIRPDMIHLLMQAQKGWGAVQSEATAGNDGTTIAPMTEEDITAQALLFFMAGFDTMSTLLSFVGQLLAMHKEVQERAQQEVDTIIEEDGGKLTYEGMQRMVYLDMVVNETLRMYPPAPITDRKCVKSYKMAATDTTPSYNMAKGEGLWIPIYAIHHDPQHFEEPDKFDPERFSEENKHKIKPFTYLPFGTGPRNCIGMRFALMEAKIAIASLLSRFDLEVLEKTTVPIELDKKSFNFTIKDGFWVGFKPRNQVRKENYAGI